MTKMLDFETQTTSRDWLRKLLAVPQPERTEPEPPPAPEPPLEPPPAPARVVWRADDGCALAEGQLPLHEALLLADLVQRCWGGVVEVGP